MLRWVFLNVIWMLHFIEVQGWTFLALSVTKAMQLHGPLQNCMLINRWKRYSSKEVVKWTLNSQWFGFKLLIWWINKVKFSLKISHLCTAFLVCILMLDSMYFKAVGFKRASLCEWFFTQIAFVWPDTWNYNSC